MEIAGVLVVQRENRDRGAFEIGGVDYWVTQAGVPSPGARRCLSRHERSQSNTENLERSATHERP